MPLRERPWARRILISSAIVWVILGVGFLAHLSGLPAELPNSVVSVAVVVDKNGRAYDWQNAPAQVRFEQERVQREIAEAASLLQSLKPNLSAHQSRLARPFRFPLRFTLNFHSPEAFSVTAKHVEVGAMIVSAPGQVRHAVLRAWVRQALSSKVSLPLFRQIWIADILMAIGEGEFSLGVPGSERRLSFSGEGRSSLLGPGKNIESFLGEIASLSRVCRGDWRPTDLLRLCKQFEMAANPPHEAGDAVSPLSFRRLVGTLIWQSLADLNSLERLQFARVWIRYLELPEEGVAAGEMPVVDSTAENSTAENSTEASLWQWRDWLRKELEAVLPLNGMNPAATSGPGLSASIYGKVRASYAMLSRKTGLSAESELVADIGAHFDSQAAAANFRESMFARSKVADRSVAVIKSAIIDSAETEGNGAVSAPLLAPGMIRLSKTDLARLRSRALVWDSCSVPSVQDLLAYRPQADRILIVNTCSRMNQVNQFPFYRAFVRYGVEGFALDNEDVAFVQMHRPSVEFAFEQRLFTAQTFLNGLLDNPKPPIADRKLGLAEAKWNKEFRAYQVLGAIEAVQWYRPVKPPQSPQE